MEFLDPQLEKSAPGNADESPRPGKSLVLSASVTNKTGLMHEIAFSNRASYAFGLMSLVVSFGCGLVGGALMDGFAVGFILLAMVFLISPSEERRYQASMERWRASQSPLTLLVEVEAEERAAAQMAPAYVELPTSVRRPEVCAVRSFRSSTRPPRGVGGSRPRRNGRGDWR